MKYRLWNTKTERFVEKDTDIENRKGFNIGEFAVRANGMVVFFENNEGGMDTYECEEIIVSVSTGLKDKNGKEIYNGDIVRGNPIGSSNVITGKVEWKNDGWFVSEQQAYYGFFGKLEVIGNIYENSELIK